VSVAEILPWALGVVARCSSWVNGLDRSPSLHAWSGVQSVTLDVMPSGCLQIVHRGPNRRELLWRGDDTAEGVVRFAGAVVAYLGDTDRIGGVRRW